MIGGKLGGKITSHCSLFTHVCAGWVSLAQEANKKGKDAKEEILGRLHPAPVAVPAPLGIKPLEGYEHEAATDFEGNMVGQIWKDKGVKIRYEIGRSQGHAVDVAMKNSYLWYRE